ncbi:MAG: aminotransferase class I/II-fold pyridoxal phosphate-dependent enzyme, partial [Muribaculaceae bacterium]|nr:aminotransferase class I/II-fold pyridoxal phosphate-dependent enzyme [Muribaculaceae bacterium]
MDAIRNRLAELREQGNFRSIPKHVGDPMIDLSSNDYLGLASDTKAYEEFWSDRSSQSLPMTSSASRLLAGQQKEYYELENKLTQLYLRPALLFNSGYHANTGIVSSLADKRTVIIADKLVHASIIDGIKLSGAHFERFRHNDMRHLEKLLQANVNAARILLIVESVYSMDGDTAPLDAIVDLKRRYPQALLMVDEAHAIGVLGTHGLGLALPYGNDIDVIMGTMGKALASMGAFCITNSDIRNYLINSARSFIFSTSLPPVNCAWSSLMIDKMLAADDRREHLQ